MGTDPVSILVSPLAKWFRQTDVAILREAGLLPPGQGDEIKFNHWKKLLKELPDEDQAEIRMIAEMKIKKHEHDARLKSLKSKKAG